jgi:hypothetical protein
MIRTSKAICFSQCRHWSQRKSVRVVFQDSHQILGVDRHGILRIPIRINLKWIIGASFPLSARSLWYRNLQQKVVCVNLMRRNRCRKGIIRPERYIQLLGSFRWSLKKLGDLEAIIHGSERGITCSMQFLPPRDLMPRSRFRMIHGCSKATMLMLGIWRTGASSFSFVESISYRVCDGDLD